MTEVGPHEIGFALPLDVATFGDRNPQRHAGGDKTAEPAEPLAKSRVPLHRLATIMRDLAAGPEHEHRGCGYCYCPEPHPLGSQPR